MSIRTELFASADEARRAAEALVADGTPPGDVKVLIGTPTRDIRMEVVGQFEGEVAPEALVGTFSGEHVVRNQAPGGWVSGHLDRRGSFADSEHDEVVTFGRRGEKSHVVDRRGLMKLLKPAAMGEEEVRELIGRLHDGHALLVVGTE